MRELLATPIGAPWAANQVTAPRVLVQFWDDARAVPRDVQACLDSCAPLEAAGFERLLFNDTSSRHFIDEHFSERHVRAIDRCSHPAMRAEYFRLCLMLRVCGLYIDANDEHQGADVESMISGGLLRLRPLVYDIPSDSMVDVARALEAAGAAERIFYVSNNPIIAEPGHPVIAGAPERATTLLLASPRRERGEPGHPVADRTGQPHSEPGGSRSPPEGGRSGAGLRVADRSDAVAISKWPLAYRADVRYWRNWVCGQEKAGRL
jgi:hypothetical protein